MKRNYFIDDFKTCNFQELATQIAYHEAGHATAIYLYNKQQQLPPVFFKVHVKKHENLKQFMAEKGEQEPPAVAATIEGGCLIENLTLNLAASCGEMSANEKIAYYQALDADVINLLAGSIAEKNYVIQRDNEIINAELLNVEALASYGNYSDMQKIQTYLEFFSDCPLQKQQKLNRLLQASFNFITQPKTWRAVQAVAEFILETQEQAIHCEQIFKVIDETLTKPSPSCHLRLL